jgi:RNA polymerase sigma-70 factor (ECF subfamily)
MTTTAQVSNRDEAARVGAKTRPDETLVAAAIGGDGLAFGDLVSRHRQAALRVAAGIVGSNQAEDVVQDALLLAHRALASLKDRTKFSRWLMAITRWRALRALRQERRHAFGHVPLDESVLETLSDLASAPRQTDAETALLTAALASIPPEYAEVIRYHFLHDLPHQKIAEFLDVPLSTVKWRCYRGKEILRCTLSPEPTCPTVCRKGCTKFPNEK